MRRTRSLYSLALYVTWEAGERGCLERLEYSLTKKKNIYMYLNFKICRFVPTPNAREILTMIYQQFFLVPPIL